MFTRYIEYPEYLELGGSVSESAFAILERKAQRYLDYYTYNRIQNLEVIPDEVKEVLTEFIERLNSFENQSSNGELISSYSNGVEKIDYIRNRESDVLKKLSKVALQWLPDYLVNRSVNFDVGKYLQSENNNS